LYNPNKTAIIPNMSNIKKIYAGRIIDVNIETALMPDGREVDLEIIQHPGGACALPLHDNGDVTLVRQFRHAAGGVIWEVPAGRIDNEEGPEVCAIRELREEVGLIAGKVEKLGEYISTPGFCTEVVHIYLAESLTGCRQELEDDEYLEVHRLPFDEALGKVDSGEISDGKTVVALLMAARRMGRSL
jgi:ADP-ribose pyrophosphatase